MKIFKLSMAAGLLLCASVSASARTLDQLYLIGEASSAGEWSDISGQLMAKNGNTFTTTVNTSSWSEAKAFAFTSKMGSWSEVNGNRYGTITGSNEEELTFIDGKYETGMKFESENGVWYLPANTGVYTITVDASTDLLTITDSTYQQGGEESMKLYLIGKPAGDWALDKSIELTYDGDGIFSTTISCDHLDDTAVHNFGLTTQLADSWDDLASYRLWPYPNVTTDISKNGAAKVVTLQYQTNKENDVSWTIPHNGHNYQLKVDTTNQTITVTDLDWEDPVESNSWALHGDLVTSTVGNWLFTHNEGDAENEVSLTLTPQRSGVSFNVKTLKPQTEGQTEASWLATTNTVFGVNAASTLSATNPLTLSEGADYDPTISLTPGQEYKFVFNTETHVISMTAVGEIIVNPTYPASIYMIGPLANGTVSTWHAHQGKEITGSEGMYTTTVQLEGTRGFCFSERLGSASGDWDVIAEGRYGPNFWNGDMKVDVNISSGNSQDFIMYKGADKGSWNLPAGTYEITVDLNKIQDSGNNDCYKLTIKNVTPVVPDPDPEYKDCYLRGANLQGGWDYNNAANKFSTTDGETYTLTMPSISGDFKVVYDGTWYGYAEYTNSDTATLETKSGEGGNINIGSVTNAKFTWTASTKTLKITWDGQSFGGGDEPTPAKPTNATTIYFINYKGDKSGITPSWDAENLHAHLFDNTKEGNPYLSNWPGTSFSDLKARQITNMEGIGDKAEVWAIDFTRENGLLEADGSLKYGQIIFNNGKSSGDELNKDKTTDCVIFDNGVYSNVISNVNKNFVPDETFDNLIDATNMYRGNSSPIAYYLGGYLYPADQVTGSSDYAFFLKGASDWTSCWVMVTAASGTIKWYRQLVKTKTQFGVDAWGFPYVEGEEATDLGFPVYQSMTIDDSLTGFSILFADLGENPSMVGEEPNKHPKEAESDKKEPIFANTVSGHELKLGYKGSNGKQDMGTLDYLTNFAIYDFANNGEDALEMYVAGNNIEVQKTDGTWVEPTIDGKEGKMRKNPQSGRFYLPMRPKDANSEATFYFFRDGSNIPDKYWAAAEYSAETSPATGAAQNTLGRSTVNVEVPAYWLDEESGNEVLTSRTMASNKEVVPTSGFFTLPNPSTYKHNVYTVDENGKMTVTDGDPYAYTVVAIKLRDRQVQNLLPSSDLFLVRYSDSQEGEGTEAQKYRGSRIDIWGANDFTDLPAIELEMHYDTTSQAKPSHYESPTYLPLKESGSTLYDGYVKDIQDIIDLKNLKYVGSYRIFFTTPGSYTWDVKQTASHIYAETKSETYTSHVYASPASLEMTINYSPIWSEAIYPTDFSKDDVAWQTDARHGDYSSIAGHTNYETDTTGAHIVGTTKEELDDFKAGLGADADKYYFTKWGDTWEVATRKHAMLEINLPTGDKAPAGEEVTIWWQYSPKGSGSQVKRYADEDDSTKIVPGAVTSENANAPAEAGYKKYDKTGAQLTNDGGTLNLILDQQGRRSGVYSVAVNPVDESDPLGVEEIETVEEDVEPIYFTISGLRVDANRLAPGIYVEVRGTKTRKVVIR